MMAPARGAANFEAYRLAELEKSRHFLARHLIIRAATTDWQPGRLGLFGRLKVEL
jgi:hypothetical protein